MPRVFWYVLVLAVALTTVACGGNPGVVAAAGTQGERSARIERTQLPVTDGTIDAPADAESTVARSLVVSGTAPGAPRGGETLVTVTVNGRPVDVDAQRGAYRVEVALELGRNVIIAKAEVHDRDGDKPIGISTAGPVAVTRQPSDSTGTLDLATAYLVASNSDDVYWLCGESEDCGKEPRCFEVGRSRVDCPVGTWTHEDPIRRCGTVVTVRLRARRIYFGSYGCRGRLQPNPQRLVRTGIYRRGQRYRVDAGRDSWMREEVNEPNRYGVPRFDVDHDLFLL